MIQIQFLPFRLKFDLYISHFAQNPLAHFLGKSINGLFLTLTFILRNMHSDQVFVISHIAHVTNRNTKINL